MHADKPFRHAEIAQRAARARANYSSDHFEPDGPTTCCVTCGKVIGTINRFCYDCDPCGRGEHDPRMDPQPGDLLAVGNDVREVIHNIDSHVEYGFPGKAATRTVNWLQWQTWARNAEVKKVAP